MQAATLATQVGACVNGLAISKIAPIVLCPPVCQRYRLLTRKLARFVHRDEARNSKDSMTTSAGRPFFGG